MPKLSDGQIAILRAKLTVKELELANFEEQVAQDRKKIEKRIDSLNEQIADGESDD